MNHEEDRYHAYLLRLWRVKEQGHFRWRASPEDAHTHQRIGFKSVEALVEYLQEMIIPPNLPDVTAHNNSMLNLGRFIFCKRRKR